MRGPRRHLFGAALVVVAVLLVSGRARAVTVAIVTASAASEAAAQSLANQIDLPVERRSSQNARNLDALVAEARSRWRDDLIVVIDAERATVSVVRPRDGTMGSRALAPRAAGTPYVVALAAVELLEIVRAAPPARAAALPAPPRPPWSYRLSLDLGIVQSVGVNGDVGLLQPTAGVDFLFSASPEAVWFFVGAHATGLSRLERRQVLFLPDGENVRSTIDYGRDELSLRLGVGHHEGVAAAFGTLDAGLAIIHAAGPNASGVDVVFDERTAFWLGGGGELRYYFLSGLCLGLGAGGAWFPVTTRFYASSPAARTRILAFQEGGLDLRARLVLAGELPL